MERNFQQFKRPKESNTGKAETGLGIWFIPPKKYNKWNNLKFFSCSTAGKNQWTKNQNHKSDQIWKMKIDWGGKMNRALKTRTIAKLRPFVSQESQKKRRKVTRLEQSLHFSKYDRGQGTEACKLKKPSSIPRGQVQRPPCTSQLNFWKLSKRNRFFKVPRKCGTLLPWQCLSHQMPQRPGDNGLI